MQSGTDGITFFMALWCVIILTKGHLVTSMSLEGKLHILCPVCNFLLHISTVKGWIMFLTLSQLYKLQNTERKSA